MSISHLGNIDCSSYFSSIICLIHVRRLAAPRAGYAAQPTHTEAGALAKQLTRAPHATGPYRRGPDEPRRTVTGPCRRCMKPTCCRGSEPLRTRKRFPTRLATIRLSRPRQAARGAAEFPAGDVTPTQRDEATPGYTPTRTPQSPVVRPRWLERSELPQIGGIGDGAAIPEAIAGEGPRPSSRADWHCRGPPGPRSQRKRPLKHVRAAALAWRWHAGRSSGRTMGGHALVPNKPGGAVLQPHGASCPTFGSRHARSRGWGRRGE